MNEQKLITDLAIAEKNVISRVGHKNISFGLEVINTFEKFNVKTYYDLLHTDYNAAVRLRKLAIKEKLLQKN